MIALYARVSTQEQAEHGHSIEEQNDRMKSFCDAMNWSAFKMYTDAGYSGATTDRPALTQMIKDVQSRRIDKVLVYKLDRLSRSQLDTLYLIEKVFLANDCDFVSISENFDTSSPFGRAMIGILAVFAQLEREQIKERMKMGKYARAKKGLFGGSNNVPTGYEYINGELITNEFEKIQIVDCFDLALTGMSPYKIAQALNEKGYRRRSGHQWTDHNVRRTLRSQYYIGKMKHGDEWFEGHHERFISDETFDRVQKILEERSRQHQTMNRRTGKANSFFGGFLVCGQCGAKYSKQSIRIPKPSGGEYRYVNYCCNSQQTRKSRSYLIRSADCDNRKWNMDELDQTVFAEIKKLSLDPDRITVSEDRTDDERTTIIKKEIEKIDQQTIRMMDLYSVGNMPIDLIQDKIAELNDQKTKLADDLRRIEDADRRRMSKEDAVGIVKNFGDIIERNDFGEIRSMISALIEKIVIFGDDLEIHWTFS